MEWLSLDFDTSPELITLTKRFDQHFHKTLVHLWVLTLLQYYSAFHVTKFGRFLSSSWTWCCWPLELIVRKLLHFWQLVSTTLTSFTLTFTTEDDFRCMPWAPQFWVDEGGAICDRGDRQSLNTQWNHAHISKRFCSKHFSTVLDSCVHNDDMILHSWISEWMCQPFRHPSR